jgi:membrane protein
MTRITKPLKDEVMSDMDDRPDPADRVDKPRDAGSGDRRGLSASTASAIGAPQRHVALAVPLRAVERNRRVAASVLAGGFAYRIFLWLLPFGLVVGGALGLSNAKSTEDAVDNGGLPGAVTNAVGDAARSAHSNSWWLFAVGVPLLLWAGFTGAKAITLIHSLVWDEPPPKPKPLQASLAFTGVVCTFLAVIALTWWVRDDWPGILAPVVTLAPLAALWLWVSLHLPRRDAPWQALVPGALLVAIGFQVLHEAIGYLLVPKLEKSTSLYGGLGATTTLLFFMYMTALLVVTAPVLNSSLFDELQSRRRDEPQDDGTTSPA